MRAITILLGLGFGFLATDLAAQEPAAIDPAQKAAIEAIIHDYLLAHPEVLEEALAAAEAARVAEAEAAQAAAVVALGDELANDPGTPFQGAADADVVIVEFLDYRCGFCRKSHGIVGQLLAEDPKLRVVYRDFPILGPDSVLASRVALAAHRQARYVDVHNAFYGSEVPLDADGIRAIAQNLGLDLGLIEADLDDPAIEAMILRNHQLAEQIGIGGTPAFIIGPTLIPGFASLEDMRQAIADERARVAAIP